MAGRNNRRSTNNPEPLMPEFDEQEDRLAREANRAFEMEEHMVQTPVNNGPVISGVPMDEMLDPERVEEYCEREPWMLSDLSSAHINGKFGLIPARFQYLASKAEAAGDYGQESLYANAAKQAGRIYHQQMKKSFRQLEANMDRSTIGNFAQSLWRNVTIPTEKDDQAVSRFIGLEKFSQMDDEMKHFAARRVFMNSKWLALQINEIPVNRHTGPRLGGLH